MDQWKEFEYECTEYLNNKFGKYAKFIHQGGADSTVPDILVKTNNGESFYIEAKLSPAQCGQFVLLPNLESKTFEYSPRNINRLNIAAKLIMTFMDDNFDYYREASTSGKNIDMPNSINIFSDWIINTYKDKEVKFFITNSFTILPIECFSKYFDVSAKYRIKKSGSGNVGKSRVHFLKNYIENHFIEITDTRIQDDKLFVLSPQPFHNQRFVLNETEYMFSARENEYEIRKLSKTTNANVIFSINNKSSIPGLSDDEFIKYLL